MADRYLLESGAPDGYLLEDGTGVLLLNALTLAETLTDNFDDNSRDTAKWNAGILLKGGATTGVTVSETNARLEITPAASSTTYSGYYSVDRYELTNSAIYAKISGSGAFPTSIEAYLGAGQDANNYYLALISNGNVLLQKNVAGSASNDGSFAYNSTTHAWLRLRYDGTSVYLDTATSSASNPPASGDWTNRLSAVRDAGINLSGCYLAAAAGTWFGDTGLPTVYFDGFNTATAGTVSNDISGTSSLTFAPSATATGLGTLSGSSTLTITDSGTLTGRGVLAGSTSLVFSPSGTATGKAALVGSTALTFAPSSTTTGLGRLIGSSSIAFSPAGTTTGIGTLAGTTALAFTGSGTSTGLGSLGGTSSLALASAGTLTGLGSLLASTALTFALSGTVGTAGSNNIAGSAALAFGGSATLQGTGQLQAASNLSFGVSADLTGTGRLEGATTFSLTLSGVMIAGTGCFVVTPKPANANLTSATALSETNVIGPARPAKVSITTVSAATGTFVPSAKPPRVQWRT